MLKDTSMRIKKDVKKRLLDLDFVKRQSESDIVSHLIDFYKRHKNEILSINTSGRVHFGKKRRKR